MRKWVYLFLLIGLLCWEEVVGGTMNGVRASAYLASTPTYPEASRLRTWGAATYSQSAENDHLARSASATVALTFDDGPQPVFTPQVLRVLQQYGVHATFFCIGSQVQAYSAIVRQTVQGGNAVGNHSWSHANLTTLSPAAIRQQLSTTSAAIKRATGVAPRLFRPPYGATNETVRSIATQLGLVQTLWTIDTSDWQRPGVATIVNTVLTHAHNGNIILLHDGGGDRSQTVQALSQIISGLEQRGFTFTTL
jgi:peptidoglycan/xylan/chitin deacetylase (PgdA/CDA1 family)